MTAKIKTPTKQGDYEVGNKKPPKRRQFGQPGGNPRHNGAWKKEDTLRYKLQQVAKMSMSKLSEITQDPSTGEFERQIAQTILELGKLDPSKRWQVLEGLTNQDSGYPKQQVEQHNIELKGFLPKPKKGKR